jgi:hypothetical protein
MRTRTTDGQEATRERVTNTTEAILKSMEKLVTNYNKAVSKAINGRPAIPSRPASSNRGSCT